MTSEQVRLMEDGLDADALQLLEEKVPNWRDLEIEDAQAAMRSGVMAEMDGLLDTMNMLDGKGGA